MSEDPNDALLREAFHDLRERDRRAIPSFERVVMRRSRSTPEAGWYRRLPWLAGAALLLAVAVVAVNLHQFSSSPGSKATRDAMILSAWRSPTRVLLQTTARDLTESLPRVGAREFGDPIL